MSFDCMQLPGDIKLNYFDKENNMQEISIEELTKGKKVNGPLQSYVHSVQYFQACLHLESLLSAVSVHFQMAVLFISKQFTEVLNALRYPSCTDGTEYQGLSA